MAQAHPCLTVAGEHAVPWAILGALMQERRDILHVEPNGDCDFQTI